MENKSNFSIATWNVCLGIANKKDSVTETLNREGISVCCIQETEIDQGFAVGVLNCNNYILELEMNDNKRGCLKRRHVYEAEWPSGRVAEWPKLISA